jgi:hypothetical protein
MVIEVTRAAEKLQGDVLRLFAADGPYGGDEIKKCGCCCCCPRTVLAPQNRSPLSLLLLLSVRRRLRCHFRSSPPPRRSFKVTFRGEPAMDVGGVAREFFPLAVNSLVNVQAGLFRFSDADELSYQIDPTSVSAVPGMPFSFPPYLSMYVSP